MFPLVVKYNLRRLSDMVCHVRHAGILSQGAQIIVHVKSTLRVVLLNCLCVVVLRASRHVVGGVVVFNVCVFRDVVQHWSAPFILAEASMRAASPLGDRRRVLHPSRICSVPPQISVSESCAPCSW